ncbi:RraA-like protein [Pluteus cervinus]|uniref:RraA-like protein n=1 Tax=Pluteus cervinus TaxID=181527 RepID=A0ACD3ARW5_9AGAR|nr:RraA-like protein [Pluteus cervinus]
MSSSPLAAFSTCELSDALVKLNVPNGGHLSGLESISPTSPVRICGPAYTVKMVWAHDDDAPRPQNHFVDTAPRGSIIIIDAPISARNAVWGGLMTAGAQARGAAGVIVSGRCRDLAEQRSANFAVFARGHSTLGQSPFTRPSEINIPLRLSPGDDTFSVSVSPQDWIVADEDGVVCVPRELESQVVDLANKGRHIDALCLADIQQGVSVEVAFKTHRST